MKEIILPCSIGLLCVYTYQKYTKTYESSAKYLLAIGLMFLLQFMLYISSCFSETVDCKFCHYLSDYPYILESHWKQYDIHAENAEKLQKIIKDIGEEHKFDVEDVFISGACGAIVSIPIKDARAKAIAIALTIIADFFKEKYYCHRALKRYVEEYRYQIFQMNSFWYQIENNIMLCATCKRLYDAENYWGEPYVKYVEYWKSWYDDLDQRANYKPGCLHTQ
jgi:hypothetical protein